MSASISQNIVLIFIWLLCLTNIIHDILELTLALSPQIQAKLGTRIIVLTGQEVHKLECAQGQRNIRVILTQNASNINDANDWVRSGDIINGGSSWGCQNEYGVAAVILRRVASVKHSQFIDQSGSILKAFDLVTTPGEITDLFSDLKIRGTLQLGGMQPILTNKEGDPQDQSVSTTQMAKLDADQGNEVPKQKRADSDFTVIAPKKGAYFFTNDQLTIIWESQVAGSVTINIYEDKYTFDNLVYSATVSIASKQLNVNVGNWAQSSYYYIEFEYDCGLVYCSHQYSDYFSINKLGEVYISSPVEGSRTKNGENMYISFYVPYLMSYSNMQVTFSIYTSEWGLDTKHFTYAIPSPSNSNFTFTLTIPSASSTWFESSYYYLYIEYNCGLIFCDTATSGYFTISSSSTTKGFVEIVAPDAHSSFSGGQTINLVVNSNTSVVVDITLKRERYGFSEDVNANWPSSYNLKPGRNEIPLLVPSGRKPSSNYYIQLEFNCYAPIGWAFGWYRYCDNVRSKRFAIDTVQPFQFNPLQSSDSMLELDQQVQFTWTKTGSVSGDVYFSIKADIPLFFDQTIEGDTLVVGNSYNWKVSTSKELSLFNHYPVLRYNCIWRNWFCEEVRGPNFRIKIPMSVALNYNTSTETVEQIIPIYNSSCEAYKNVQCATLQDYSKALCSFCKNGGQYTIDVTCADCYAHLTTYITTFELDIELAAFKLLIQSVLDGSYSNYATGDIGKLLSPLGYEFNVGPVHLSLGIFTRLKYYADAGFVGSATMNTGLEAEVNFYGSIVIRSGESPVADFGATPNINPILTAELNAQVNVSVGIIPVITFEFLGFGNAAVGVQPTLLLQGKASTNGYPAENLNFASNELCRSNAHYVQLNALAALYGKAWIQSNISKGFEYNIQRELIDPKPLYRHCLFKLRPDASICMSFATTLSFLEMSSELFGQTIASTLSAGIRALGSDIVGMVEAVTQRFNDVQICIKLVGENEASEIEQKAIQLLQDKSSLFYTHPLSKYLSEYSIRASIPSESSNQPSAAPSGIIVSSPFLCLLLAMLLIAIIY